MVCFLLGQQSGFTKYPCFLCMWDSRAKNEHWIRKEWPKRQNLIVGSANVINEPLVEREKIVFPLLHIKLGLIKQFEKALKETQSNLRQVCIECIDKVIQNALIFNAR